MRLEKKTRKKICNISLDYHMANKQKHSIEELVEQWAKEQLKGIKLYAKNDFINAQIEKALKSAPSKKGGKGPNYPDIKCIIPTADGDIPVMIEVKGMENALIKRDEETRLPDNVTRIGEPNFTNIAKYAVNGAVHYANAIVRHTDYKEVLAIGVNGYKDETDETVYEVSAWYLSRKNLFIPKEIGYYSDLSFLQKKYQQTLLKKLADTDLTEEEIEQQKSNLEDDIERKLKELNQKMQDELHIVVNQRVQLVTGLIMAGLGVRNDDGTFKVHPLQEEDLRGDTDSENNDGVVIMRKIKSYLKDKNLPLEKIDMIVGILNVVFINSKLELPINGESRLKTLYHDIKADIIPFLTGELHNLDFTGRLFNVLNAWVAVPDGAENDVVLTPRSVTELMAKLCQVDKDSYVWDFATGSAGFLISAMHLMIADAKNNITNIEERSKKILQIKTEQLLGIERLAEIYLLAVLNMILMKDGSANIIQGDSLKDFKGNYEQGKLKGKPFPADVFLLNPPYSAPGKGFVFVKRALGMMKHRGMAAVLIQENAGSGNGLPYTKEILKNNTLVASIKMPVDLFIGKSSVQTAIYLFKVGTPHTRKSVVKFVDFSNDGYSRMNRRHSSQSVNLRNIDNARERYAEVVNLVLHGKGVNNENLTFYKGSYIEDYVSLKGDDWTYGQHKNIDPIPTEAVFRKVVKEYLSLRLLEIIKNEGGSGLGIKDCILTRKDRESLDLIKKGLKKTKPVIIGDILAGEKGDVDIQNKDINGRGLYFINSGVQNYGIKGKTDCKAKVFPPNTITIDFFGNAYYRPFYYVMATHNHVFSMSGDVIKNENVGLYLCASMSYLNKIYSFNNMGTLPIYKKSLIYLPITPEGDIDYNFMDTCIGAIKKQYIATLMKAITQDTIVNEQHEEIQPTTNNVIKTPNLSSRSSEEDFEPLMAAESFERFKWGNFDKSICDFFGSDKTILIGCYKGKKYEEWIRAKNIYTIRVGDTKGSMEDNRELFDRTSLLVLYELGKTDKLSAYKIVGNKEMGKEELLAMDYPNKKPRKSYMAFSITPLDMDLTFLEEHHLVERIIDLNSENAKGTPVFIHP